MKETTPHSATASMNFKYVLKKEKTHNLPSEFGETKASVEEASSVLLREPSSSAFSLWFQAASEEKSV